MAIQQAGLWLLKHCISEARENGFKHKHFADAVVVSEAMQRASHIFVVLLSPTQKDRNKPTRFSQVTP